MKILSLPLKLVVMLLQLAMMIFMVMWTLTKFAFPDNNRNSW